MSDGLFTLDHDPINKRHYVSIFDTIESEQKEYADLINHLTSSVRPEDTINLRLASEGGALNTMITLINCLRYARARIDVEVISPCYSAAAIMALCGDSLTIHPHSYLMYHHFSAGYSGKFGEIKDATLNDEKNYHNVLMDICTPFLTKKEVEGITSDKDVYILREDTNLQVRMKRHFR